MVARLAYLERFVTLLLLPMVILPRPAVLQTRWFSLACRKTWI